MKVWKRIWEDFFESNPIIVLLFVAAVIGCFAWIQFVLSR